MDCEGGGEVFAVDSSTPHHSETDDSSSSDLKQLKNSFFRHETYLTVSGQLHLESMAQTLSRRVYTLTPAFRAERHSRTTKHLSEFWMLEAEIAFMDDLPHLLDETENIVKAGVNGVLNNCVEELSYLDKLHSSNYSDQLRQWTDSAFLRMSYSETVEILSRLQTEHSLFKTSIKWGDDLGTEHELYLASKYCQRPVFITDYPTCLKPFYMRVNDDDENTVACMDLIVPGIGELLGGSVREDRADNLVARMQRLGMDVDSDYKWYVDLRRMGGVRTGGFGIGVERMVRWVSGAGDVRETIAYPRTPGRCAM